MASEHLASRFQWPWGIQAWFWTSTQWRLRNRDAARTNQGSRFEENWFINITCITVAFFPCAILTHVMFKNQFSSKLLTTFLRSASLLRKRHCVDVKNQASRQVSAASRQLGSRVRILAGGVDVCVVCCRGISDKRTDELKVRNAWKGQNKIKNSDWIMNVYLLHLLCYM